MLDPPDGLNLGSLGMRTKLAVALVLSCATVTLQDVLVTTVSWVLVAHKAADVKKEYVNNSVKVRLLFFNRFIKDN